MSAKIELPIIDIAELLQNPTEAIETVKEIGRACRDHGFFYIRNHGVNTEEFLDTSKKFFSLPRQVKEDMHIKKSGNAYRGYFGHSEEKTNFSSKTRDWKEGAYFSVDFPHDHPHVLAGKPMYGENQWPPKEILPGFKEAVESYSQQLSVLGYVLMSAMARSLGLDRDFFKEKFHLEAFPQLLMVHYPPFHGDNIEDVWGIRKHTDYGVLTILLQDDVEGLEVLTKDEKWIEVQKIEGTFLINLGDALEVWTDGAFTARPHRVRPSKTKDRFSVPYFFEPNMETVVSKINYDNAPIAFEGTATKLGIEVPFRYGDYLTYKYQSLFYNY